MPTPRVSAETRDLLRERNLTLWICMHPMKYSFGERAKVDKDRVHVQIAGPGLRITPWGYGATTAEAVANALNNTYFRAQLPGLDGALARLEKEMGALIAEVMWEASGDVPF